MTANLPIVAIALLASAATTAGSTAATHCEKAFPSEQTIVMQGYTTAGIKNKFSDTITIEVTATANENGSQFNSGRITTSRLPDHGFSWSAKDDETWGNQCLDLHETEGSDAVFLALSWDVQYHHPNVHGLVRLEDGRWVFRGYLDNADQQYHEAALTLSWDNAQ